MIPKVTVELHKEWGFTTLVPVTHSDDERGHWSKPLLQHIQQFAIDWVRKHEREPLKRETPKWLEAEINAELTKLVNQDRLYLSWAFQWIFDPCLPGVKLGMFEGKGWDTMREAVSEYHGDPTEKMVQMASTLDETIKEHVMSKDKVAKIGDYVLGIDEKDGRVTGTVFKGNLLLATWHYPDTIWGLSEDEKKDLELKVICDMAVNALGGLACPSNEATYGHASKIYDAFPDSVKNELLREEKAKSFRDLFKRKIDDANDRWLKKEKARDHFGPYYGAPDVCPPDCKWCATPVEDWEKLMDTPPSEPEPWRPGDVWPDSCEEVPAISSNTVTISTSPDTPPCPKDVYPGDWEDIGRAASRPQPASMAALLAGRKVKIEWLDPLSDWEDYTVLQVYGDWIYLRGLDNEDGHKFIGDDFLTRLSDIKDIVVCK